jgi:hypothetical protein
MVSDTKGWLAPISNNDELLVLPFSIMRPRYSSVPIILNDRLQVYANIIKTARKNKKGVDFTFSKSGRLSIAVSSEEPYKTLPERLRSLESGDCGCGQKNNGRGEAAKPTKNTSH